MGSSCRPHTRIVLKARCRGQWPVIAGTRRSRIEKSVKPRAREASLIEETQAGLVTDDPTPTYRASDPLWKLIIRALRSNNGMRLLTSADTHESRPRNPVGLGKLSGTQIKRMVRTGGVPRDQETRELIRTTVVHEAAAELVDRLPSRNWLVERDEVVLDTFVVMNLTAPLEPGDLLNS